ncbi:MAG: hypothetical protein ACJ790_14125 [Myxococcaceae bacterium]
MGKLSCLLLLFVATAASGCNPYTTCDVRYQDSQRDDGGVYKCARPEDCPRISSAVVCTTDDQFPETECVSCTKSTCLRHIPVKCK